MPFEPDIIVTAGDPPESLLVVQVVASDADLGRVESELKRYMFGMQFPVGLVITPETVRVYRDSYTSYAPESVVKVDEFSLPEELRSASRSPGPWFERAVVYWLEDLQALFRRSSDPQGVRESLLMHVRPAIVGGKVRISHPQLRRTGTE
jgi:hypothetical protein